MKVKIWTREEFHKNTGLDYAPYWNSEGKMNYLYGKVIDVDPYEGSLFIIVDGWHVYKKHTHLVEEDATINKAYNRECMSIKGLQDFIKSVQFNAKKGVTTVILQDGRKGMSHCCEGDKYDVDIGFALALTNALFGSKTQAHKYANKYLNKQFEKENKKKAKIII